MVLILIVLAIVIIYIVWNTDCIDKITDYLSATPEERKKRREYEKDVKELMKQMEENEASAKHYSPSETTYRRGCGTFDLEAIKSSTIKSAEKMTSVYSEFIKKNKFTYATKNKYCIYDNLILIAFLERNNLVEESEENAESFTTNFFNRVISLASAWYSIDIKEAREMFFNRVYLYDEIFCRPNEAYGKKLESCAWELTQLIKYDIAYKSYQEYSSSSPLIVKDIFEETRIQLEVFDLIKGVSEKLY